MTSEKNIQNNWYVLYTKPRHEFKAALQLDENNFHHYLPTVTTLKQWSDRKKKVTEPIFRSYIFFRGTEKERLNALQLPSIVSTVCFRGNPAVVPEWQIYNLKKMLEGNPEIFVTEQITTGTHVKVVSGPFEGVEGIVTYVQNQRNLAVSIETLHRSILVTLPAESVTKKVES
ncbi:UpxY family transcription antiterminator [Bacteroidota bacterium]